jgi:hypothetical protein
MVADIVFGCRSPGSIFARQTAHFHRSRSKTSMRVYWSKYGPRRFVHE